MFLTGQGTPRRRLTKNEGFPATDAGRTAKDRLGAIDLNPAVVTSLHALRSLPPAQFGETQWAVLGALMRLLPVAVGQLRLVFQEEGRVDFTEIAIGARTALGSDEAPTDLAFALDCRIQHLLIDEFQDTSQSQYTLLTRLISDWQPGDGRTLFLVGDPMQSIYGFREAEVGLFLRARADGVGAIPLTPLTLSVNFRSSAEIVEWVNRALSHAFPATEELFTGAVTYEPSVPFTTKVLTAPFAYIRFSCESRDRKPSEFSKSSTRPNRRAPAKRSPYSCWPAITWSVSSRRFVGPGRSFAPWRSMR